MELKLYLNKFAKVDNIENYSFRTVLQMRDSYKKYIEDSEGKDPDFPLITFNGNEGKKISVGKNVYSFFGENEVPEDFNGIKGLTSNPLK